MAAHKSWLDTWLSYPSVPMGTKAQLLKGKDASNVFTHMATNRSERCTPLL